MSKRFSEDRSKDARLDVLDDIKRPDMYSVIMHNDDYTPMDFVVFVLRSIFRQSAQEAERMMLAVHNDGACEVGVYVYDIALTKKSQTDTLSAKAQYPLKLTVEPKE